MRPGILGVTAFAFVMPMLLALYSCGSRIPFAPEGDGGRPGDGGLGEGYQVFGDGGGDGSGAKVFEEGGFTAPDCPGCTFPPMNAPACPGGTPGIQVVYPVDGVLVPPNMNVISVHWTPYSAAFKEFEVDFENTLTDMRVVTKCAAQTIDTEQPPAPSGGCELALDPAMWAFVANQNRGSDALAITVRGTTDGKCASKSANTVHLSFALEDMVGALYYWKSTVSAAGVGGDIWVKSFGDTKPEQLVSTNLQSTCNGCHSLSRDGLRMVISSDDDDSDDEYGDVGGSLVDMATLKAIGGVATQGPGFSTFYPDHTEYVTSNGFPNPPPNVFSLFDGVAGTMQASVANVGGASDRPTMPDWSPDGKNVVFVMPTKVASWTGTYGDPRNDDSHVFGGSLFLLPYTGTRQFGAPTVLVQSAGENNYYPGYSPDGQLLVFDRVAKASSVNRIDGCTGSPPKAACPNDSFSNPAARLMLMKAQAGAAVVDMENANGSSASAPVALSNSWPKWSPFLQAYKGDKLLWVAFSSTRDYGLRVRNHQPGMYQCYPADSYEDPGSQHGQSFQSSCQQPQLWMAAVDVSTAEVSPSDPSKVGFWLPFQDIKTHNHTPQWTQKVASQDGGACVMQSGNCQSNSCCAGLVCQANGTCGVLPK